ncbi:hypothetical protein SNE40_003357 [Patella caerulea]|uniref:Uncharacterized protein n=1 Tax=Patella caerulea TaxID=87958 RepID=A0AAN8KG76_PATCE
MSLFSGGRSKEKDLFGNRKCQFYVEFLGWMECRGLRGDQYTDPVIKELRKRQQQLDNPPKLTIQVSKKELKISQEAGDPKKKSVKKIKFPTIPATDVTYATQSRRRDVRLDDIVACIYLGFMPRTQRYVHVHVYRFDGPDTAATFVNILSEIVASNTQRIYDEEIKLANWGEIDDPQDMPVSEFRGSNSGTGSNDSNYSGDDSSVFGSAEMDSDLQSLKDVRLYDSVADELRSRLGIATETKESGPILLPPKDYDTISRAHGNILETEKRRGLLHLNVSGIPDVSTGKDPRQPSKMRNSSGESGIDLHSPSSSEHSSKSSGISGPSTPSNPTYGEFAYPARNPNFRKDDYGFVNSHQPVGLRVSDPIYGNYQNDGMRHSPRPRVDDIRKDIYISSPPEDYENSPDFVELRHPESRYKNPMRYSGEPLNREPVYFNNRRPNATDSPIQIRRSQEPKLDFYESRPGDYGVRRVNSMYR